jgi:hypothetical protein
MTTTGPAERFASAASTNGFADSGSVAACTTPVPSLDSASPYAGTLSSISIKPLRLRPSPHLQWNWTRKEACHEIHGMPYPRPRLAYSSTDAVKDVGRVAPGVVGSLIDDSNHCHIRQQLSLPY